MSNCKNMFKQRHRLVAIILVMAMLYTAIIGGFSKSRFTDVPDNHWAASYINAMADGGLIGGYGNGKYGPADQFRVDHMAKIICAAKGYPVEAKNGFWAYTAIDTCINELHCLPDFGEINAKNYSIPCTRELAYYMLMKGLGPKENNGKNTITAADIPDYSTISYEYRDAILEAYQYGLTIGYDAEKNFNPKGLLNRAQAAAMFVRAGYTTAAKVPTTTQGKTVETIYDEIKALGGWEEFTNGNRKVLQATEVKYGGLEVVYNGYAHSLSIVAIETNTGAWFNKNGQYVDVNGNIVSGPYNDKGVLVCASGYSYVARQRVKQLLDIAFPTESAEAYAAMKSVFLNELHESKNNSGYPSAIRWLDGHSYSVAMCGPASSCSITVGQLNDKDNYNDLLARNDHCSFQDYIYKNGNERAIAEYELTRW